MSHPERRRGNSARASPADAPAAHALERLRAGDRGAFNEVYEAYRGRLYSFLLRLTQDEQLARDLFQETWMRLAANARRLSPSTQVGPWLFSVARNLFVSHRRWSIVDKVALSSLRHASIATGAASPLEQVSADLTQRRLERALGELGVKYREVLLLVVVEGFSPSDVAAMLRLEPATVRQRLARGRALLKRKLEERGSDAGEGQ